MYDIRAISPPPTRFYSGLFVGLVIAALLLDSSEITAKGPEVTKGSDLRSCIVDVGENGACLYGNWLSGRVDLRIEGCNVFLGGILVFPKYTGKGQAARDSVCADHMLRKAQNRYEYLQDVFAWDRLYLVAPNLTQNIPETVRQSQRFLEEIAEAIARQEPITNDNWDSSNVLFSSMAELIRKPIPVAKCSGF